MIEKIEKAFLCFEKFISEYGYYLHSDTTNLYARAYTKYVGTSHFNLNNVLESKNVQITKIGFGFEKERQNLRFYFTDNILIPVESQCQLKDSLKFLERIESFGKENSIKKRNRDIELA